ncbi:MAG: glycosyltransferase family 2 protein, partial [Bacteroidota bacterium]
MINLGKLHKYALKRRIISAPTKGEKIALRALIALGIASVVLFVVWFAQAEHIGYLPLYLMLTFAVGFKLLRILHEWYHYAAISVPVRKETDKTFSVDMLTTFVKGEPYDMIEETLTAMVAVRYPHKTYLCDEADDPYLKDLCKRLGVIHVYRGPKKVNAKAGNINYALENVADGEITVILDPDHIPTPDFLDRVLPYFDDPEIGYVQCVQTYGNQQESFIAKAAAEQTYHFYGPMMMSMNAYGTAQAIGANCTFRRKALDSIGGHAAGLSEDMHTAMRLHAEGWTSIYVPEQLTRGRVPSNLPAYFSQQLKWSRGTFELLFRVYPSLFRKLNWRQKLHYFLLPFHFLSGLVVLLDILVPILSLVFAKVAWHMNLIELGQMATPMLAMILIIRIFAQRWVLEEHERGFHFLGGILWTGTWWINLVGFVYAIFNVKVPYIPTPKEDEFTDSWKLSIPNIIAVVVSVGAILYGLSIDWTPYALMMAGFALLNISILGLVVLISQQKTMNALLQASRIEGPLTRIRAFWWNFRHFVVYRGLRHASWLLVIVMILGWGMYDYQVRENIRKMRSAISSEEQPRSWFYTGVAMPAGGDVFSVLDRAESTMGRSLDIVSIEQQWGQNPTSQLPGESLEEMIRKGIIPLISWLPYTESFTDLQQDSLFAANRNICRAIYCGKMDDYLTSYADWLSALQGPVFIRFAPMPDAETVPWGAKGGNDATDYQLAWEYVVKLFAQRGTANAVWVWSVQDPEKGAAFLPKRQYVDWVSVDGQDRPMTEWYTGFHDMLSQSRDLYQKPVLIFDRFQRTSGQVEMQGVKRLFPEVRAWVLPAHPQQWAERGKLLRELAPFTEEAPRPAVNVSGMLEQSVQRVEKELPTAWRVRDVQTTQGKGFYLRQGKQGFQLTHADSNFYVKGVAYNSSHSWRDGFLPLTRDQLEKDFGHIKAMGANTIRRFGGGVYDKNILRIAQEKQLKVLYGVWTAAHLDYWSDAPKVDALEKETLENIKLHVHDPAILGWTLGNETWHNLRFHHRQPYLTRVRKGYLLAMNRLAKKIKAIDPHHPVILAVEHGS